LILVLLFTAAQSAVRLAVVPLWAHYDEITHFEYVQFIVEHGRLPRPDAGSQFAEAPGYYVLQAAVQRALSPATVMAQVTLARAVSALLALGVAALAYATTRLIFPDNFLLAVAVPAAMATIFGYVDLMSAVNNDVAAVAAISLLVYAVARLIRRGYRFANLIWLGAAVAGCIFSKTTAWIGLPLAVIGVILAGWRWLPHWLKVIAAALTAMAGFLTVGLHMPANWQRQGHANYPGRNAGTAVLGQYVFRVEREEASSSTLWQALPAGTVEDVRGQEVTVGAWVRAPKGPLRVSLPVIGDGKDQLSAQDVIATPDWAFEGYTFVIPAHVQRPVIYLPGASGATVEYDGVILVIGRFQSGQLPQFDDANALGGVWNGVAFTNLLRNASAEQGWPMLRPEINSLFPWGGVNHRLQSFYDWQRTLLVYWPPLRWQFVTFWTAYHNGFDGLPRIGLIPFAAITGLSVLGLARVLVNHARQGALASDQWQTLIYCGFTVAAALAMSILRIDPVDANGNIFYVPTARHFYVAIVPTMLLVMMGWLAWWPPRWKRGGVALLVLACYGLGVWSLLAVQMPNFLR
jgi:hypothetical protein